MNKIIDIVLKNFCNDHRRNLMEQEIYKLFISQCKNIEYLCWTTHQPLTLFPRASIFFSQLYELYIDIDSVNSDALYELAQICKDLNTLSINSFCSIPDIFYLIDAQRNLKKLNIYTEIDEKTGKELSKALARNRTIINDLHLNSIYNIVLSSLTTLVNLKKLTIFHWENYEKIQQYLAIYEFPNLQELTLIDGHLLSFKEISLLIEKTIGNITRIIITTNKTAKEAGILIKAISDNCPKINDLRTYIEPKDFIHIKSLLLNCRSLNAISLNSLEFFINENDNNIGDELLFHFLQNL